MRLIPHNAPAAELLKTAAAPRNPFPEGDQAGPNPPTESKFSGKDRAVFAAIALGGILLCFLTFTHWRQRNAPKPAIRDAKVPAAVSTSVSTPIVAAGANVTIRVDQIHVSAISLGDPRMAIINGRLVGEGEKITLPRAGAQAAVSLRLQKISDGEIELSNGAQVITARLELAPAPKKKR